MGCDIHLHIEVKVGGDWQHLHAPSIDRDYRLFAKMAGVRNEDAEIDPITKPRGLPADIAALTRFDADGWGVDGHSHSFLLADEIAVLSDWAEQALPRRRSYGQTWDMEVEWGCYLFRNSFAGFSKYPDDRLAGLEDVRFVFWFDN